MQRRGNGGGRRCGLRDGLSFSLSQFVDAQGVLFRLVAEDLEPVVQSVDPQALLFLSGLEIIDLLLLKPNLIPKQLKIPLLDDTPGQDQRKDTPQTRTTFVQSSTLPPLCGRRKSRCER